MKAAQQPSARERGAEGGAATREPVERAERDAKAPVGETNRPRGGEEAEVKSAEQREAASRPDQEVG